MSRPRPLLAALAAAVALLAGGAWSAVAQLPPVGGEPDAPSSPTPPPPEEAPAEPTPGPPPPSDGGAGGGSGEGAEPASTPATIPPEYERLIRSVRRTPANNTRALVADLAKLERYGLTRQQATVLGMGRFPVAGEASFVDDWWFPRFVPRFHLHVGTDIFAAHGTPVRAPVDGRVKITNGRVGGLAVYVTMKDGTYFYMAHLSGLAPGLAEGQTVRTGQVVGYVGDSGNARGGKPHVHLEIHPRGKGPINPKPYLDRFIADARAQVPVLLEHYRRLAANRPAPAPEVAPAPPPPPAPKPLTRFPVVRHAGGPLLWAASMSPTIGGLGLAEAELVAIAQELDWASLESTSRRLADRLLVRQLVTPLVPAPLRFSLGSS